MCSYIVILVTVNSTVTPWVSFPFWQISFENSFFCLWHKTKLHKSPLPPTAASPPAKQMNLGEGDGLVIVLVSLLVDDVDELAILHRAAVQRCHGGVAAWPCPYLHRSSLPSPSVCCWPTQRQVNSWDQTQVTSNLQLQPPIDQLHRDFMSKE